MSIVTPGRVLMWHMFITGNGNTNMDETLPY